MFVFHIPWPSFLSLLNFCLFVLFLMYWHFRAYLRLWLFYVLFVGVWTVVVSTAFQVFTSFCPEQDKLLRDWKAQVVFSVFLFVFFFLPLPAPGEIVLWLEICNWRPSPLSLSLGNAYFAASLKLINGVWEVFLFVTKLNILFTFHFAGSQWVRANSKIQNFLYYRLPDIAISIRKNSIPDSIWLC